MSTWGIKYMGHASPEYILEFDHITIRYFLIFSAQYLKLEF